MPYSTYRLQKACLALASLSTALQVLAQTTPDPANTPDTQRDTTPRRLAGQLESVVVTASKYEDDSLKVPAFVTYLTRTQIADSGARTINEAVIRLAGIPGRPSLAGGSEYSLDPIGFGDAFSSNMVIAIDGVPLKEGDSAEPRLSGIPIEQVERIEIQRGGASVLYGENAVAGVINIITRASSTDFSPQSYASIYSSLGSFNTQELSGSGYYAANGIKLSLAGLARVSDGYRRHSANQNHAATLDAQVQLERSRLGLSLHTDDLKADLPGSLTVSQFKANPRQRDAKYRHDEIDSHVIRLGGFLETDLAGYNLKLTGNRRTKDIVFNGTRPIQTQPNNLETVNEFWDLVLRKTSRINSNQNTLLIGAELNRWQQDRDNQFGIYQINSRAQAIYLKNNFDWAARGVRISAGYRNEAIRRSIDADETDYVSNGVTYGLPLTLKDRRRLNAWEAGVAHTLTPNQTLYARLSQSYRMPNSDEMACASANFCGGVPAINLIDPQTSIDQEFGWKYARANTGRAGIRLYQSRLHNEIAYDDASGGNVNLDRTRRNGLDLELALNIWPDLAVSSFVSFRSSRFVSGPYQGNHVPLAPQRLAALRADWRLSGQQTLGVGWNYISKQFAASDFQNKFRVPSYATVDLRYSYRTTSMEAGLTIRNLFDKPYYSYGSVENDYSDFPRITQYLAVYPDPGRSITASVKVHF